MKVILHASCNYVGCEVEDEIEVPDDTSKDVLAEMAYEFALDMIAPEGWYEIIEEDEDA